MITLGVLRFVACGLIAFIAGRWTGARESKAPRLAAVAPDVEPHLYSPPPKHGEVAVPSTVRDARGAVHNLRIGGFRFNVLESRAGTVRSGDVHKANQLDMVFSGHCRVTTRERGHDVTRDYYGGQFIVIPAHTPHIFRFVNDTVMAEWWDADGFEARYFKPYRQIVDAALEEVTQAEQHRRPKRWPTSRSNEQL